jgi:hypothetical protein
MHGRIVMAAVVAGALGLATACSSSSKPAAAPSPSPSSSSASAPSPSPAATAGTASATAAVTRTWVTFFDGKTPAATKIALLQNGQRLAPVIQAQAGSQIARATTATVTKVTVASPTTAAVTYTVDIGGRPALQNQVGHAVLAGGGWKVSLTSFCQLLTLQGQRPPMCPVVSGPPVSPRPTG